MFPFDDVIMFFDENVAVLFKLCSETSVWWKNTAPESKVRGANRGPIWGRQDPGGPNVGLMSFVIWDAF